MGAIWTLRPVTSLECNFRSWINRWPHKSDPKLRSAEWGNGAQDAECTYAVIPNSLSHSTSYMMHPLTCNCGGTNNRKKGKTICDIFDRSSEADCDQLNIAWTRIINACWNIHNPRPSTLWNDHYLNEQWGKIRDVHHTAAIKNLGYKGGGCHWFQLLF